MCEPRGKKPEWQLHVKLRDKTKICLDQKSGEERQTGTLKVVIPSHARESMREQLDFVGINRATLFPDLGGAAKYLEWAVHQRKKPYEK